jgi:hypothetical protein
VTYTVLTSGGDFAATEAGLASAFSTVVCGDVIQIQANITITGSWTLPLKNCSGNPIIVESNASTGNLPDATTRTNPTYTAFLPKLKSVGGGASTIYTTAATNGWTFRHIEFLPVPQGFNAIISIGDGQGQIDTYVEQPYDLVFDRVIVRGDPIHGQKRGWNLDGRNITITRSYCYDIMGVGQDAEGSDATFRKAAHLARRACQRRR